MTCTANNNVITITNVFPTDFSQSSYQFIISNILNPGYVTSNYLIQLEVFDNSGNPLEQCPIS